MAPKRSMTREFLDADHASAHDAFQLWRAEHQDGLLLTLTTRTRANLHGARCQHLGSGPPYYTASQRHHSLTAKRKICGSELELLAWATDNGVTLSRCQQCVRDGFVGAEDQPPSTSTNEPDGLDVAEELVGLEGAALRRLIIHRRREWRLREAKIEEALRRGRLRCEVPGCNFDFEKTYGVTGRGYAQVHHLHPLSNREGATPTTLDALAVVCANCHVMIHRGGENRQIDRLIKSPNIRSGPRLSRQ